MRIFKVAIYILAALATCELSNEANANTATPAPAFHSLYEGRTLVASGGRASDLAQVKTFSADIQSNWARSFSEPGTKQLPPSTSTPLADLRQQFLLPVPPVVEVTTRSQIFTGSTIASPTAFGANWGDVFVGGSYQSRARFTNRDDGGVVAGFGLGDSRRAVGLEVAVSSYSTVREGFLNNGGLSFKLHRLLSNDSAIAFGVENAVLWGTPDAGSSVYGVVSKIFSLRANPADPLSRLTVSVGGGGGRFRSEYDVRHRVGSNNVFGSVGLQVIEQASVIADWTGQDLFLGVSIAPFRRTGLVITPGVADVTGTAGNGARFILGVGYGVHF